MKTNKLKSDWIFEATRFLVENTPTTNDEERRMALLNEADSIQADEETEDDTEKSNA